MLYTLHMCIMIVLNFTWLFVCNNGIRKNICMFLLPSNAQLGMLLLHLDRTSVNFLIMYCIS